MISDVAINAIIAVIGLVLSVCISMFVSGTRWGRVETMVKDLQDDRVRKSDINELGNRLSRIEGMFTLTVKSNER